MVCMPEVCYQGAYAGTSPSVGLNIFLPHKRAGNLYQNNSLHFRHFFRARA